MPDYEVRITVEYKCTVNGSNKKEAERIALMMLPTFQPHSIDMETRRITRADMGY